MPESSEKVINVIISKIPVLELQKDDILAIRLPIKSNCTIYYKQLAKYFADKGINVVITDQDTNIDIIKNAK